MPTALDRTRQARRRRPIVRKQKPAVVNVPRARAAPPPDPDGTIEVHLVDGTRQPALNVQALVRLFDGRQRLVYQGIQPGPTIRFTGLHVADNLDDRYTVSVAVDGHAMAGFTPVVIRRGEITPVSLMLIPKSNRFDFSKASWTELSATHPSLVAFLANGAPSPAAARARYEALLTNQPRVLAGLLNIWTAMEAIQLTGNVAPVDFLKRLDWTNVPPAPDRFYCYAQHPELVDLVVAAARQRVFSEEPHPEVFHAGATRSYKQVQFGEANVQLTFHEQEPITTIDGVPCTVVEPDIDYYKDLLAHGLLEVLPGMAPNSTTDPVQVYVLRWIAGQQAGIPPFDPPYTIVAAQRGMASAAAASARTRTTRRRAAKTASGKAKPRRRRR